MFQILSRVAAVAGLVVVPLALFSGTAEETKKSSAPARTPDCVYVGTPHDVIDEMVEQAAIKKGDLVYDLGCGDARILIAAAKRHGCRCVGYDINPVRIEEATERIKKNNVAEFVKLEQEDIFTLDLKDADVIMLYLLPKMNEKLIPQLEKLKPGARIVTHDYSIKGIVHEKTLSVPSLEDGVNHEIYVYKAPLKKES